MDRPEHYFGRPLNEFFGVYTLEAIRGSIIENKESIENAVHVSLANKTSSEDVIEKISKAFQKSAGGFDEDICKDMLFFASLAQKIHPKLENLSFEYIVKRTRLCIENGFNKNVKADRALENVEKAVNLLWDMTSCAEEDGVEYVGEFITLKRDDVMSKYYPKETPEDIKTLACSIMEDRMQEKGLCFQYWKQKNSTLSF